jgi:D-lactate dehydrogenase (cytochrome)
MTSLIDLVAVTPLSSAEVEDSVRSDSESVVQSRFASYLSDESGLGPGRAEVVFLPTNERQVADFLREMNSRKIPVTISGGRTGIVGGAVPTGGALLSLDRMNRIVGTHWDDSSREWRVTAEPGVRLKELHERVAKKDLRSGAESSSDLNWRDLAKFEKDPSQYFYPPDPTEETASLGGTVATDASGARTYHFGRTRQYVRAIRIVLATGDVLNIRRGENMVDSSRMVRVKRLDSGTITFPIPSYESPPVKSAAGYLSHKDMDLIDLFIGSEGTLGVITLIEVALLPAPEHTAMFLAFFPSQDDAVKFTLSIRSVKAVDLAFTVHSMEYFDCNSLRLLRSLSDGGKFGIGISLPTSDSGTAILSEFAYDDLEQAIQHLQQPLETCGSSLSNAISGIDEQGRAHLLELRHAIPEAINKIVAQRKSIVPGTHKIGTDTSVPDEKLETMMRSYSDMLKASKLEHYMFGHIAENHLHVNLLPKNEDELARAETLAEKLAREAVQLGGTVSAEHGIGKMKRSLLKLMFSDVQIKQMLATKRALDPNLILCSGNIMQP